MEIWNTIRLIIGFILFIALGLNFFYQAIRALIKLKKINEQEETIHTFNCQSCQQVYQINGTEFREKTSIWSTSKQIKTLRGQSESIRFECPQCGKKAFQEKQYDTNVTALAGNVRAQFDDHSREVLKDILVKGFLPILIAAPILGLLV